MKGNDTKSIPHFARVALAVGLVFFLSGKTSSKLVKSVYQLSSEQTMLETGLAPVAAFSDSVFCDERLLDRVTDYRINYRSGRITFMETPKCDSIIVVLYQLPGWLTEKSGNEVPQGKKFLVVPSDISLNVTGRKNEAEKVRLSGNKSFSFTVGRSGQAGFSQGLNVDFEAALAGGVKVRGSVADRIGSSGQVLSAGGVTTVISELDKYFFEIEGQKFSIQGGDITTVANQYLPLKRIKGMRASYKTNKHTTQFNIGRPAGRYESNRLRGVDGSQGPYQLVTSAGLPTGAVPGSDKIYLDGQILLGGNGRDYQIDYPAGQITFSPRVLITSRSRIEVDFEAATNDYEQAEMSGWSQVSLLGKAVSIGMGGRRETDEKDRYRFGALSASEINKLQQAGDSASGAYQSGVVSDSNGAYIELIDSTGTIYYKYVGRDQGDYSVSFSFTGEGQGDYVYLGESVYLFIGSGQGEYLPIRFLPLPKRSDFWAATARFRLFPGVSLKLDYQLSDRDGNLFSSLDDEDNRQDQVTAVLNYKKNKTMAEFEIRRQQKKFEPARRLDKPDFNREWAVPDLKPDADERRYVGSLQTENSWGIFGASGGFLNYKDSLSSKKVDVGLELFGRRRLSPRFRYQVAQSQKDNDSSGHGLYERYETGLQVRPAGPIRFDLDYDRELKKDKYSSVPDFEKYSRYRGNLFYRQTVVTLSRRIDYKSDYLGRIGPRLDKISIVSEERIGRLAITASGLASHQKRLDSDKSDLNMRLFATTLGYTSRSGWLNFRMEYRQNREEGHVLGYRYLQVTDGQGNYRFEAGQYFFDPDGDFIRLEEKRGESQNVTVGGKNHSITIYPGRLRLSPTLKSILSQISLRLQTEVTQEQAGSDKLHIGWLLPWTSRSGRDYLNRVIRERYGALMLPRSNYYVLNWLFTNSFEERAGGLELNRTLKEFALDVKGALSPVVRITISGKHIQNRQRGLILVGLALREDRAGFELSYSEGAMRITPRIEYSRFSDDLSGGEGRGWSLENSLLVRRAGKGEIRFDLKYNSIIELVPFKQPEYLVTDGDRFGRSGLIRLVVNYDIGRTMRLSFNLKDRLSQDRSPEFVGRGELVASF